MASSIFDFPITDRFEGWTKRTPEQGQCRCPAHEDRTASLSVGLGEHGRCLTLHCHAGCDKAAILRAISATWSDLFERDPERKRGRKGGRGGGGGRGNHESNGHSNGDGSPADHGKPKIVAAYSYRDVAGNELFQVVRFIPKSFRQRHREGNKWVWKGVSEDQRILYRLPELVAAPADSVVYLCYSADTDILTRSGWKAFPELEPSDIVAQYNKDSGAISFTSTKAIQKFQYSGQMVAIKSNWCDLLVTPEHRQLTRRPRCIPKVLLADQVRQSHILPAAGLYCGTGGPGFWESKLLSAWLADGVNESRGLKVSWNIKKQRKKHRLRHILSVCGVEWSEFEPRSTPGWTRFVVNRSDLAHILKWCGSNPKELDWSCLDWSKESRESFLDELSQWDGDSTGEKGTRLFTSNKKVADIVCAMAALTNRHCGVRTDIRDDRPRSNPAYVLNINERNWRSIAKNPSTQHYEGFVYCCTVPDGFLVVRRNGKVTISGNCEGEKDTDRLRASGLIATTSPGGADAGKSKRPSDKWLPQYTESLRNRVVVIVPDADAPGRQHAANVAGKLLGTAAEVSILDLPLLPGIDPSRKWDVSDWLDAGGTREQFMAAVARARSVPLTPESLQSIASSPDTAATPAPDRDHAGDIDPMDGARKILADHYTHSDGSLTLRSWRGTWHHWRNGAYFELSDAAIRALIWRHIDQTHTGISNRVVGNVLAALHSLTFVADSIAQPAWLQPTEPRHDAIDYLSTEDGIIHIPDLLAGDPEIIPHTPEFFSPLKLPFSVFAKPGESETPVLWLEFLRSVWPKEGDMTEGGCVDTLQEWMGYCLTHSTALQKMLLIVGPSRSGKGTISRMMRRVVGEWNCTGPTLSSLSSQHGLWPLAGKSLAIVADARLSNRVDQSIITERLLSITGEDAQLVERKYYDPVVMRLPTRFVMLTNELPKLTDASGALANRMIILPMTESFLNKEDLQLEAKLCTELPAIFRWAVEGLRRLNEKGRLTQPAAGKQMADELAEITSPIKSFLNDRCLVGDGRKAAIDQMYGAYQIWCGEQGCKALSLNYFGRDLRAAVPSLEVRQEQTLGVRARYYCGVGLKPTMPEGSSWSTGFDDRPTIPFSDRA